MSRNHVNIARFYDWSEDLGTCVSVTKLYRDLAFTSRVAAEVRRPVNIQWCSNGVRLTPGRMFARDKNVLTKGEREIINGICRNRGSSKEYYDPPSIKSHQDAWLAGRQLGRVNMRRVECGDGSASVDSAFNRTPGDLVGTSRRTIDCSSTDLQSRVVKSASNRTKVAGYYCIKGRPVTRSSEDRYCHGNSDIPSAPPSTPDRIMNPRPRVPPINNGQGAILIEDVREARQSARKVRMDVFLPRITSEHLEDDSERTSPHPDTRPAREQFISDHGLWAKTDSVCESKAERYPRINHSSSLDSTRVLENSPPLSNLVYLQHRGKEDSLQMDVSE
ncbi:uncharacterized protein LOC121372535 isoform X2 [Gigantopelta aegis]|nr:uncharacterized protein LOC121372535 isoform X2 [Gigantopelta aegis]XP_041354846.1 uncharacterized protein LOC121372535 isoform X2 [Gigantopelta aegis]XP_041354847.1 uncharacterized protein LOC121372535 isoform X2 [Gigantopelta aegis]XP_041354848.1 uncharacterized protein LOC121372535 isoform X2 [Gigantopelta aegis]XP_041354849.1 uncharacterized protein LOC121372535 isoform X2 [Gigantopelta aegis]